MTPLFVDFCTFVLLIAILIVIVAVLMVMVVMLAVLMVVVAMIVAIVVYAPPTLLRKTMFRNETLGWPEKYEMRRVWARRPDFLKTAAFIEKQHFTTKPHKKSYYYT